MPAKRTTAKKATAKKSTSRKAVKKTAKKAAAPRTRSGTAAAPAQIDRRIRELGDWRGKTLEKVRRILKKADPAIVEEWKWEVPVWSHDGLICTGETYRNHVKLTFARGASLEDPAGLFNSSLEGKVRRAIDIRERDEIDEAALTDLVRAAVALNLENRRG